MSKQWRNTRHIKSSGNYHIRGILFEDGVAPDSPGINESVAEFFEIIGVVLEDGQENDEENVPGPETPEGDENPQEVVKTADEDTVKTAPSKTAKKTTTRK